MPAKRTLEPTGTLVLVHLLVASSCASGHLQDIPLDERGCQVHGPPGALQRLSAHTLEKGTLRISCASGHLLDITPLAKGECFSDLDPPSHIWKKTNCDRDNWLQDSYHFLPARCFTHGKKGVIDSNWCFPMTNPWWMSIFLLCLKSMLPLKLPSSCCCCLKPHHPKQHVPWVSAGCRTFVFIFCKHKSCFLLFLSRATVK